MVNVEANESIGSPKRKDPLPELQSPKGGLFAPFGEPKPLPLGEVSPKVTERASPAGKSRCAAMGRLFGRAIRSQCQSCLAAALPSQSGLRPPAPPKGEPLACRSGSPSYNLSVSLRSTAPLVGEPLAKPFTLRGLPRPPLGRGGGSASALTERLSSSPFGRGGIAKQ